MSPNLQVEKATALIVGGRFGCRSGVWSAECDLASQKALQIGVELGRAQGASGAFGAAQFAEVLLRVGLRQTFQVRNPIQGR
jgi:hypothetical protein